jgi:hypothetical protein
VTTDEELDLLDQQLRRLKIEYDVFFNNPTKRPPNDVEWKVISLIRKFSDGVRMSFPQRYRYNEMAQRYAVYGDLWRKKMRIREEGYRRPQDALLSVAGLRANEKERGESRRRLYGLKGTEEISDEIEMEETQDAQKPFTVQCSGVAAEREQVKALYQALTEAKQKAGEKVSGDFDSFAAFVAKKTTEIRKQQACDKVVYSVEMEDGRPKLKAKAKS